MIPTRWKALALDALYQVLDNWVFRILFVLALIPILLTFLFGFTEDGIVLLFGFKTFPYEPLLQAFGGRSVAEGMDKLFIEGLLQVVFRILAGNFGVLFCIAATSFFVPRMIEKGAADVLFHKPLSRFSLYMSRYFAGLVFVGLLSTFMVLGMFLGLLLVSGHYDPGILWAAPSLTYLFALIHAVAMLVGVVTRSTVASILLTILFFWCNGCVHNAWIGIETQSALELDSVEEDFGDPTDSASQQSSREEKGAVLRFFLGTIEWLHYILPKTTDTDYIATKLRESVRGPAYEDSDTLFQVVSIPEEWRPSAPAAWVRAGRPGVLATFGPPRWNATAEGDRTLEIWRRERNKTETEINGKTRVRPESTRTLSRGLEDLLEGADGIRSLRTGSLPQVPTANAPTLGYPNKHLSWAEDSDSGAVEVDLVLFRRGEFLYGIVYRAPEGSPNEPFVNFLNECNFKVQDESWYATRLSWTADWRFNIWFSIGSSVAFTALLLGLGCFRLSRIDF